MHSDEQFAACILGVGARTPLGLAAPPTAAAVRAGISGFSEHPFMVDTVGNAMVVARAEYLGDVAGVERLVELATPAALEALEHLPGPNAPGPIPVIVGLPLPRRGLPAGMPGEFIQSFSHNLAQRYQISWVEVVNTGHSAGLMAVEAALGLFTTGRSDFCLVGGVDSYLEPETLEWLEECDQLHSAGELNNAWGFVPGEAAGFLLLGSPSWTARTHSLASRLVTVVTELEEKLIKTNEVCLGHGLTRAFERAFGAPGFVGQVVDQVICDLNGEPYRSDEYGFATIRTAHHFANSDDFLAPADCWGDVGAASGPLFISLALAAAAKGYAPGSMNLIWTSSESGERSAALVDTRVLAQGLPPWE